MGGSMLATTAADDAKEPIVPSLFILCVGSKFAAELSLGTSCKRRGEESKASP